jgi:hypothetical protein
MAQFYLNVRNGETLTRDPKPYRFSTAQAARDAAVRAVQDLLAVHPEEETGEEMRIEIADETGHPISLIDIQDMHPTHSTLLDNHIKADALLRQRAVEIW